MAQLWKKFSHRSNEMPILIGLTPPMLPSSFCPTSNNGYDDDGFLS